MEIKEIAAMLIIVALRDSFSPLRNAAEPGTSTCGNNFIANEPGTAVEEAEVKHAF